MASLPSSLLRGSRAIGASSSNKDRSKDETQLPEAYQQERPPWRPPLHPAASNSDVPDLFPTKPNQAEDDMSQLSVRKGFAARPYVRNESFSAHELIYNRLAAPETLPALSLWMDEIMQRRHELDRSSVAPSQYKTPSRVTLNEAKLANYVRDLADPNVPLTRLSRSVPHGFRGEKLFEMLWAGGALPPASATGNVNNYFTTRIPSGGHAAGASSVSTPAATAQRKSVDISRAVWFIRALGAAELSSLRNKSAATIVPEITSNLCTWMAKQLAELNLVQAPESSSTAAPSPAPASPSTHFPRTPGAASTPLSRSMAAAHFAARTPSNNHAVSSPSTAPTKEICTVLQNEPDEERWIAKWSYSLSLARHLHAQHLLDRCILVRWIVDAFAASNLVQLPFLLELVQEVLVFILRRRCFFKPFLAALLIQIPALDARLDRGAGGGLRSKLMLLLRIVCETSPDALVSPRLWSEHATTLTQLLHELDAEAGGDAATLSIAEDVERTTKPRIERLLLHVPSDSQDQSTKPASSSASTSNLQQHRDIQALDSFDMKNIDRVFLQPSLSKGSRDDAAWTVRIETILTWACTDRRSGVARQYLAATLIEKIRFGVAWDETSDENDQISLPAFDIDHHGKKTRKINVEPMLIKWLGDVEASLNLGGEDGGADAGDGRRSDSLATVEVASIVVLVGELARRGVFSYTKYLQRLIARGMTTAASSAKKDDESGDHAAPLPSAAASRDSLHLRLLRSLPLYDQPASVYQQRRQAIYGDRTKETYEDAAQRRALRQLQAFLPFAFAFEDDEGGDPTKPASHVSVSQPTGVGHGDPREALSRLWSASRFVRCKIFRNDLLPAVTARVDSLNGEQLSQISAVLVAGDDFEGLAQLLATLLLRPLSDSVARAAFNLVIEFSLVWRSMDIMGTLNQLVRQQLNHSSSVRNDRQAVMASTTLLRLRTLIEGVPSRIRGAALDIGVGVGELHDAIQPHVRALRPSVDALLDRFAQCMSSTATSEMAGSGPATAATAEGSDILTPFRNLFMQPDATSDEIIERTIVESVLERSDPSVIPAAVRLIDQLYLEASLEIDERHARWLSHLAGNMEHSTHKDGSIQALLSLLTRLVAHGTLNLQLAMETFVLPYLLTAVRRMTDPATRGAESTTTADHLIAVVGCLSEIFASSLGESAGRVSYEDARAFGAQTMLLFAQINLVSLLKAVTCLICASDESSPLGAGDKAQIETFWKALLRSEPMQIAFRQDPRQCTSTIRETSKSMWGCTPARVMDLATSCLDPTSLLLGDVTAIDARAVKARLDGWDTAVVATELVEIFERLQSVESSLQTRADSKTKALAVGVFDDLFVRLPEVGAQLMRDCMASSGMMSRFTDIGIRILVDKVRARSGDSEATTNKETGQDEEVESVLNSVLRMCEQQDSFMFNATDADSCGQLLLLVISSLESFVNPPDQSSAEPVPRRLACLLHGSVTLQLLHLVLRFGCLWSASMKAAAVRLVRALVELTRLAGERVECGSEFVLLMDTLGFVLDEMPALLLGAVVPELEVLLAQSGELATAERAERMQQLPYGLENVGAGGGAWFVASSAGAAVRKGWFTPGGLNPWECAEYLDGPQGQVPPRAAAVNSKPAGSTGGGQNTEAENASLLPGARFGWPTKLALNTAIPVSMLGLRVTRDLVPNYASPASPSAASVTSTDTANTGAGLAHDSGTDAAMSTLPLFVESERSYGERVAGEPAFSRDLRRGLLVQATLPRNVAGSHGSERGNSDGDGVGTGSGGGVGGQARMVAMSNDSIPVIDLTWDDDEIMLGQPLEQQQQQRQEGAGDGSDSQTANSRKRRMSKRD